MIVVERDEGPEEGRREVVAGVGDGLEVWKDSENSRRHSSAPRACKFARIDSGREKRRGKEKERRAREVEREERG